MVSVYAVVFVCVGVGVCGRVCWCVCGYVLECVLVRVYVGVGECVGAGACVCGRVLVWVCTVVCYMCAYVGVAVYDAHCAMQCMCMYVGVNV